MSSNGRPTPPVSRLLRARSSPLDGHVRSTHSRRPATSSPDNARMSQNASPAFRCSTTSLRSASSLAGAADNSSTGRQTRLSMLSENPTERRNPTPKFFEVAKGITNTQYIAQRRRLAARGNATLDDIRRFSPEHVDRIIYALLDDVLGDRTYDSQACSQLVKQLSENIQRKMKNMRYPRYKFVVVVTIGEQKGEDITIGSRCLWNQNSDNFSSVHFSNKSLFSVATVYAVFQE